MQNTRSPGGTDHPEEGGATVQATGQYYPDTGYTGPGPLARLAGSRKSEGALHLPGIQGSVSQKGAAQNGSGRGCAYKVYHK